MPEGGGEPEVLMDDHDDDEPEGKLEESNFFFLCAHSVHAQFFVDIYRPGLLAIYGLLSSTTTFSSLRVDSRYYTNGSLP